MLISNIYNIQLLNSSYQLHKSTFSNIKPIPYITRYNMSTLFILSTYSSFHPISLITLFQLSTHSLCIQGGDENELRRHIFGNTIDSLSVKKLVRKIYPACKCQLANEKVYTV